ncbi:MAG: transglutaminase-like cysteine peptidase, partial [Pseudomonadota bacterium]
MAERDFGDALCFGGQDRWLPGAPRMVRRLFGAGVLSAAVVIGSAGIVEAAGPQSMSHLPAVERVSAPMGFHGVCERYAWACSPTSQSARQIGHNDLASLARRVNTSVNKQVREVSDFDQYRVSEHWSLPTARGGDCEDFALLKKRELMRLGVAPERLLIATALTQQREAHAVLVLRTDAGDLVLDNLTNRIRPWEKTGYTFLRMQDPARPARWQLLAVGG